MSLLRILRSGGIGFWRSQRGSLAIEATLAVSVLVLVVAVLFEAVMAVYEIDYMDRAARTAARAVALAPGSQGNASGVQTIACDAIKRELDLPASFDCTVGWTLTVDTRLTPQNLLAGASPAPANRTGDMVRVSIEWDSDLWTGAGQTRSEHSVGVARTEPAP